MAFLLRILQVLLMVIALGFTLTLSFWVISWVIIGALEALGLNNSLVVKWLKSKLPKRKPKKKH